MKKFIFLAVFSIFLSVSVHSSEVTTELSELAQLTGDWKLEAEVFNHETETSEEFQTHSKISAILKGRYLEESLDIPAGILGKEAMSFRIVYSFDPFDKIYRISVLNDSIGLLDVFEGTFEDGRLIITNEKTTAQALPDGQIAANRNTISNISLNRFESEWEGSHDGGKTWHKLIRATYIRVSRRSAYGGHQN